MTPTEFVLWLNGASEIIGDTPPTPEQWAALKTRLSEVVGKLVSSKLLEAVEDEQKRRDRTITSEEMYRSMLTKQKQALESAMAAKIDSAAFATLTGLTGKLSGR